MAVRARRTAVGVAVLAVLTALAVGAVLWLMRGEAPDEVAEDYLAATWHGDDEAACDLSAASWRHVLYNGRPYADCAAYAEEAGKERDDDGFAAFEPDTDVVVSTRILNEDDESVRVDYVVELRYHGDDRAGFDALWQGGGATDRGTIELRKVDGEWRIAGVDAG